MMRPGDDIPGAARVGPLHLLEVSTRTWVVFLDWDVHPSVGDQLGGIRNVNGESRVRFALSGRTRGAALQKGRVMELVLYTAYRGLWKKRDLVTSDHLTMVEFFAECGGGWTCRDLSIPSKKYLWSEKSRMP